MWEKEWWNDRRNDIKNPGRIFKEDRINPAHIGDMVTYDPSLHMISH